VEGAGCAVSGVALGTVPAGARPATVVHPGSVRAANNRTAAVLGAAASVSRRK